MDYAFATASAFAFAQFSPPRFSTHSNRRLLRGALAAAPKSSQNLYKLALESPTLEDNHEKNLHEFIQKSKEMITMGGPPRWFSPLECANRSDHAPILFYLPGIFGLGTGLWLQHDDLGKIFDIWCLHIPLEDRTTFSGLLHLVEQTIQSEHKKQPKRPIYLVGESLGSCLALSLAARNPTIDTTLILANPATSFRDSSIHRFLIPILESVPDHVPRTLVNFLRCPSLDDISSFLTKENIIWKFEILKSASAYTNARIEAVKATTLLLASKNDAFFPSVEEVRRIRTLNPNSHVRVIDGVGHEMFTEKKVNLVTLMKLVCIYKRRRVRDYVSDYIPPTRREFKEGYEYVRKMIDCAGPVLLSTLENGRIVRGLDGVPRDGPVLYVGYHMLTGLDIVVLVPQMMLEGNLIVRGMAHPLLFTRRRDGFLPPVERFDLLRLAGSVPVSGENFYKLLASNSHVLLYPGGVREACHRKGEKYVLHWPEQPEFVRMAASFGAKIVPFGTVGEDDFFEILLDYDEQMRIPMVREFIRSLNEEGGVLRRGAAEDNVANQDVYFPILGAKIPGRFYYLFGKPIETKGRKGELRDKHKAQELYSQIKAGVNECMHFLKEKRKRDPYRSLLSRMAYKALHGPNFPIPTFPL